MNMTIAYVQGTKSEIRAAVQAFDCVGIDHLYRDKPGERINLQAALKFLRDGDELLLLNIRHAADTLDELHSLLVRLHTKSVFLHVLDGTFRTGGNFGESLCDFLYVLARLSPVAMQQKVVTPQIVEWTGSAHPAYPFNLRRRTINQEERDTVTKLLKSGMPPKHVAVALGMSKSSVYKVKKLCNV